MSYAMEDATSEMSAMPSSDFGMSSANIGKPASYRIVRSGARPLKFKGSELAMAMSFTPEIPYWYEINLYRTTDSDFVAAVRLFHQAEHKRDTVEAWRFKSVDEALAALEHYDAAGDVEAVLPEISDDTHAAELAAQAMELRARIESQRQHYRGLVGEVLYELDAH